VKLPCSDEIAGDFPRTKRLRRYRLTQLRSGVVFSGRAAYGGEDQNEASRVKSKTDYDA